MSKKESMHNPNWAPQPRRPMNLQGLFPVQQQAVDETVLAKARMEAALEKSQVSLKDVDTADESLAKSVSDLKKSVNEQYVEACEMVKSFVGE